MPVPEKKRKKKRKKKKKKKREGCPSEGLRWAVMAVYAAHGSAA